MTTCQTNTYQKMLGMFMHLFDRNLMVCIVAKRKQLLEVICQGSHSVLEKDSIIFYEKER